MKNQIMDIYRSNVVWPIVTRRESFNCIWPMKEKKGYESGSLLPLLAIV